MRAHTGRQRDVILQPKHSVGVDFFARPEASSNGQWCCVIAWTCACTLIFKAQRSQRATQIIEIREGSHAIFSQRGVDTTPGNLAVIFFKLCSLGPGLCDFGVVFLENFPAWVLLGTHVRFYVGAFWAQHNSGIFDGQFQCAVATLGRPTFAVLEVFDAAFELCTSDLGSILEINIFQVELVVLLNGVAFRRWRRGAIRVDLGSTVTDVGCTQRVAQEGIAQCPVQTTFGAFTSSDVGLWFLSLRVCDRGKSWCHSEKPQRDTHRRDPAGFLSCHNHLLEMQ